MTPDNPADAPTDTTPTLVAGAAQPRLADRLSALVGQAASRQEDSVSAERLVAAIAARVDASTAELRERIAVVEAGQAARMSELESLVGERLQAIEAAIGSQSEEPGVKAHLDEVGGALVLRLDEVLAGLAQQVEASHTQLVSHAEATRATLSDQAEAASGGVVASQTALTAALDDARHQLATQLEEARGQLAAQVSDSQADLTGQVAASRAALEGFEQTLLSHIGDLAAGVVELGDSSALHGSLTREDLDGVAQAAQLDGVTASTTALRQDLDEVVVALGAMRTEFNGLQAAIEKRVDDAALALAETLVAVITSMPSGQGAPAISYDFDDSPATLPVESAEPVEEAGTDGDWPATDEAEDVIALDGDELLEESQEELLEESHEQATGVDEGSAEVDGESYGDTDLGVGTLETAFVQGEDAESPARRKGIFRR